MFGEKFALDKKNTVYWLNYAKQRKAGDSGLFFDPKTLPFD